MKLKTLLEIAVGQKRNSKISEEHTCRFCGKNFVKEKTLAVHMCESKRRYLQKDERRVQSAECKVQSALIFFCSVVTVYIVKMLTVYD
jgi:ribosomal protein L37AE/L43A